MVEVLPEFAVVLGHLENLVKLLGLALMEAIVNAQEFGERGNGLPRLRLSWLRLVGCTGCGSRANCACSCRTALCLLVPAAQLSPGHSRGGLVVAGSQRVLTDETKAALV